MSETTTRRQVLASRWIIAIVAILAFALTLPSLGNGLAIDDHLYRARVVGDHWDAGHSMRDLFVFANPDRPDEVLAQKASGELSWWAAPRLRWGFMRPIPALLHHAELRAYGRDGEALMHLHSVLWMAALAACVALLYRRLFARSGASGARWIAGFAAVLYAVDDGHGFCVGWLANRGSIMGACFAVLALVAHHAGRRRVLGPLLLALALACSEQMVAVCAFLISYALFLDDGSRRSRWGSLLVYAQVVVFWYILHSFLGYGSVGTGSYTDPFSDPLGFASNVVQRVPILAHSQLGALPADLWEVLFVRRGLSWVMSVVGFAFVAIVLLAFARLLRHDRLARFWAVSGLGALVVVCGAHPNDRHLLLVGVAGSALVAQFCAAWLDRDRQVLPRGGALLAVFFLFVHLVAAPVLLPIRARIPGSVARGVDRIDALLPSDPLLANQELVLVNVPFKYLCNHASVARRSNGGLRPAAFRCLGVTPDEVTVTRTAEKSLRLRPAKGYLRFFEDTNVRARGIPFHAGDRVELPALHITVTEVTPDGRPAEVEFEFGAPLSSASFRVVAWLDGAYRELALPSVGGSTVIPAQAYAFGDLLEDK